MMKIEKTQAFYDGVVDLGCLEELNDV